MVGADHLWPIDDFWRFHAGGDEFKDLNLFTAALEGRYGKARSAEDYARKAQALAYEGERAMFEAFGRNKYTSTGVIQWMLNNAWPSMIRHLYDHYLRPGGGYFGTKKANEGVHVQYSYDDRSIVVVNELRESFPGMKVSVEVLDRNLQPKLSREVRIDLDPDGVRRALVLPAMTDLTTTYFLRLALEDPAGKRISSNFYWLSTRDDELDWERTEWYYTPVKSHADLTELAELPRTTLEISKRFEDTGAEGIAFVEVENTGSALAFQVRLKVSGPGERRRDPAGLLGRQVYRALPGEKREIRGPTRAGTAARRSRIEVEAWNVPKVRRRDCKRSGRCLSPSILREGR